MRNLNACNCRVARLRRLRELRLKHFAERNNEDTTICLRIHNGKEKKRKEKNKQINVQSSSFSENRDFRNFLQKYIANNKDHRLHVNDKIHAHLSVHRRTDANKRFLRCFAAQRYARACVHVCAHVRQIVLVGRSHWQLA